MGVQRDNVPHFKGLIEPEWNQIRPRAWQHFYALPRPFENGYFTSKTAKWPRIIVPKCMYDDYSNSYFFMSQSLFQIELDNGHNGLVSPIDPPIMLHGPDD